MSQFLPAGADLTTAAAATLPDAPDRFSTMIVVASRSCRHGWMSRAMTSVDPPGGYDQLDGARGPPGLGLRVARGQHRGHGANQCQISGHPKHAAPPRSILTA